MIEERVKEVERERERTKYNYRGAEKEILNLLKHTEDVCPMT